MGLREWLSRLRAGVVVGPLADFRCKISLVSFSAPSLRALVIAHLHEGILDSTNEIVSRARSSAVGVPRCFATSLKESVLELGFLSGEEFDRYDKAEHMIAPSVYKSEN